MERRFLTATIDGRKVLLVAGVSAVVVLASVAVLAYHPHVMLAAGKGGRVFKHVLREGMRSETFRKFAGVHRGHGPKIIFPVHHRSPLDIIRDIGRIVLHRRTTVFGVPVPVPPMVTPL